MSQIQLSLLLHRQALHWLLNKLSRKYPLSISHKLCHLWSSGKSFQIYLKRFENSLSGANSSINLFRKFPFDSQGVEEQSAMISGVTDVVRGANRPPAR